LIILAVSISNQHERHKNLYATVKHAYYIDILIILMVLSYKSPEFNPQLAKVFVGKNLWIFSEISIPHSMLSGNLVWKYKNKYKE